jgi:hypothetical protein
VGKPKPKPTKQRGRVRGPKPSITLEVVKRVAKRFGMGIPLEEALATEGNPKINLDTWKKALAAHPEFSPHYAAAKGKFLEQAMERLYALDRIEFLLTRRFPHLFAAPAPVAVSVSNHSVLELPQDILDRARELLKADERKS